MVSLGRSAFCFWVLYSHSYHETSTCCLFTASRLFVGRKEGESEAGVLTVKGVLEITGVVPEETGQTGILSLTFVSGSLLL